MRKYIFVATYSTTIDKNISNHPGWCAEIDKNISDHPAGVTPAHLPVLRWKAKFQTDAKEFTGRTDGSPGDDAAIVTDLRKL